MFLSKAISNSCRHRTPLIFTRPSQCVQTFSSDAKDDEIDPQTAQKMVEYVQQKAMQTVIPDHARELVEPKLNVKNLEDASALSGVRDFSKGRNVLISRPARHAMSSGVHHTRHWTIEFSTKPQWKNPLMGWNSGKDGYDCLRMQFETKEQAMNFCQRQGWVYKILEYESEPHQRGDKSYSYNFFPENLAKKLKQKNSKAVMKSTFEHAKGRKSHYQRPLTFHGDAPVRQHGGEAPASLKNKK